MIPGQSWSAPLDASSYPREFNNTAGKVLVHHPVIRNWRDFKILSGRAPLEVTLAGGGAWIGSLSFEVATTIHFDDRLVSLHNPRISDVKGDNGPPPAEVLDLVRKAMKSGAENTPFQVIMHNNFYYLCHDGAWYSSARAQTTRQLIGWIRRNKTGSGILMAASGVSAITDPVITWAQADT